MAKVERVVSPLIPELDSKTIENLLFYLMRAGISPKSSGSATRNVEILTQILNSIADHEWLLKHEVNDHFAIL